MNKGKFVKYLLMGLLVGIIVTFLLPKRNHVKLQPRDYAEIAAEGILRAATEYNSISFYVDGDTVSGFHYELIEAFARDHGLKVSILPEMSFEERMQGLEEGRFDMIANGLLATSVVKDSLLLTTPISLSRQVLVQRKATADDDPKFIKSQLDLGKKTLHVVKGSPTILRIHHLGSEIADTIYIKEVEKYGAEQLISMVAHGDIDYAVCEESIARKAAAELPQIDINTAIGFTQFYSWGVNKQSPVLLDSLNAWLERFKGSKEYLQIYRRYYK